MKNNRVVLFIGFLTIYFLYSVSPTLASFLSIFAPIMLLHLLNSGNDRGMQGAMAVALLGGLVIMPYYLSLYFILTVPLPVLILLYYRRKFRRVSWQSIAFSALPVLVMTGAALILFPEQRTLLQSEIGLYIEEALKPLLTDDISRLDGHNQFAAVYNQRELIAEYLVYMMPALLYASVALIMYFTEKIYYRPPARDILPLPDALLGLVIISGISFLLPYEGLAVTGMNGILVAATLYFLRGYDIVRYYVERWKFPRFARAFIYIIILFTQTLIIAVALIGFASIYIKMIREDSPEQDRR